jgi:2-haloacid dehalogenase
MSRLGRGDCIGEQISVDEMRAFKPAPAVYRHAARRLGRLAGQIRLVSSNGFDSIGASAAGMRTVWVNRSAGPFDTPGEPVTRTSRRGLCRMTGTRAEREGRW